jgi:hypothetical protein
MEAVVIVFAVIVVLALIGLAAWAVRRRESTEVHSVEGYRQTLDTLQGIRTRSTSGSVRALGGSSGLETGVPDDEDASPGGISSVISSNETGTDRRELLFVDPAITAGSLSRGTKRTQDRAMSAMNHRPRRMGAPLVAAVVVLALLVVVVVLGAHSRPPHHKTAPTTVATPTTSGAPGAHSTATTQNAATHSTSHTAATHKSHATAPPTTTIPTTFKAVSSTATTATYAPPSATYSLGFTTTGGDCWVNVTSGATTVFSKTMLGGQTQTVAGNGSMTVTLGAPSAVTITLDHEPLILPAAYGTPFVLTLTPAA